ncbi:unnamed protein product [Linum trigynum]|uniref:Uncharacterized protein n=1 Tax=Linum trigynum TaxID=586398 RepID=A0AAV2F922_9ROSI
MFGHNFLSNCYNGKVWVQKAKQSKKSDKVSNPQVVSEGEVVKEVPNLVMDKGKAIVTEADSVSSSSLFESGGSNVFHVLGGVEPERVLIESSPIGTMSFAKVVRGSPFSLGSSNPALQVDPVESDFSAVATLADQGETAPEAEMRFHSLGKKKVGKGGGKVGGGIEVE